MDECLATVADKHDEQSLGMRWPINHLSYVCIVCMCVCVFHTLQCTLYIDANALYFKQFGI